MSKGRRTIVSLSLSPANPDAMLVAQALKDQAVPQGQRSAKILEWAAAYLSGKANETPAIIPEIGLSEEEIDGLLDDF